MHELFLLGSAPAGGIAQLEPGLVPSVSSLARNGLAMADMRDHDLGL